MKSSFIKISFSLLLVLFVLGNVLGQSNSKVYNFVNVNEGISKVGMSTILQDHKDFLWIGTNGDGLYKYDGIDYTSYKYKVQDSASLSSSLIYSTYLDNENKLWVGTEEGLNLYNRDLDNFNRYYFNTSNSITDPNISVISLNNDGNDNLLVGTFEKGLFRLKKGSNVLERVTIVGNNIPEVVNINNIQVTKENKIYVGTNFGLKEYDQNSNILKNAVFSIKEKMLTVDEPIQYMLTDDRGILWVGTISDGLIRIDPNASIKRLPITSKRVLSMVQIMDGTYMVGTENDGLFHIDKLGEIIRNYRYSKEDRNSIKSNSIWSLFVDYQQRIWMGYYNSGIAVYDELYDKFNHLESLANDPNSLEASLVTGIAKDDNGDLWITSDGGGIDVFNPRKNTFRHINIKSNNSEYKGLKSLDIQTVFIDSKKNKWFGSWNHGLYLLKNNSNRFINYNIENTPEVFTSNSILTFAEDSKGVIWIGTFYNGIISYDPKSATFTNHDSKPFRDKEIHNSAVRKILVDKKDNIWVGSTQGLYKVQQIPSGDYNVEHISEKLTSEYKNHTSVNHILSLYLSDDSNHLWIGTRGAGVCKYNLNNETFEWHNTFSGLKEHNISSIIESTNGDIWISGNNGITKIDRVEKTYTNYTSNDGLLSNDFNLNSALRGDNGLLYFGNYRGIDFFNPENIKTNKTPPSLHLTGFKLFNKDVEPNLKNSPLKQVIAETDSIVLKQNQSVFTIEYSAINYTRPEKNQYAYYLEGLLEESAETWNYVGNSRSATYTNLDFGNYTFKLKAANNDGLWTEEPIELKITILPPWWKTNLAITTYVLLFLSGVYLLNKITQNRIKEKQILKNERDQRAREEELHEKKLQFFTNISHEFRTPLTLIINPLQDIMKDNTLNLPQRVREKHNIIYKNTDRLYRLINELMDLRKLELNKVRLRAEKINLVEFTNDLIEYFKEEAYCRNIYLSVDSDVPNLSLWADKKMLEKIIFNILSNAIKVTPEGGAINVELTSNDDKHILPLLNETEVCKTVEVIISDTGPGLKKKQVKKIFERFYQVKNLNETYYGGTGIGLEVVQNFVQLHKGKIEVNSEVNKGTTFRVIFPRGKKHFANKEIISPSTEVHIQKERYIEPITQQQPNTDTVSAEAVISGNAKSHTLLIVEDNVELRNYLKNELKDNYKIITANNGLEGVEKAISTLPDIIITDVIMPEMDGFEFCKKIKTDIKTSHIPLLMLTAKARIDDRIEGIGYGADAYMVKPFDMRLLKLRLSQIITSRELIFDKYFGDISGAKENANATSIDKEFIQKVLRYINDNISDSDLSVEVLASQLHLSRSQLYRKIKTLTGQTVNELLRNIRLQKAKQILESGSANISEVSYKVGFSSPSYFTKCFKAHFNMLPTDIEVKD